jgi:hypothetical protein
MTISSLPALAVAIVLAKRDAPLSSAGIVSTPPSAGIGLLLAGLPMVASCPRSSPGSPATEAM